MVVVHHTVVELTTTKGDYWDREKRGYDNNVMLWSRKDPGQMSRTFIALIVLVQDSCFLREASPISYCSFAITPGFQHS